MELFRTAGISTSRGLQPFELRTFPITAAAKIAPRLATPTDLKSNAVKDIAGAMNAILADTFALYMKTKNFHWHVSGPHFRDYHLLLDEQADQIFSTTDEIAERVRKIGGNTLRSIGDIARQQRLADNDAVWRSQDMLSSCATIISAWLRRCAGARVRRTRDIATASLSRLQHKAERLVFRD